MKKLIYKSAAMLMAVFMLAVCACPVFATSPSTTGELEFQIVLPETTAKAQKTTQVDISLKNTTTYTITDIEFLVQYETSKVSYNSGSNKSNMDPNTTVVSNANGVSVKYSAKNTTDCKPIPAGESFTISLTFTVAPNITDGSSTAFTISEPEAFMRTDITSPLTDASNLTHTFTFKPSPTGTVILKKLSDNANLSSIIPIVNGTETKLNETFSAGVTNYTFYAVKPVRSIDFKRTPEDSGATSVVKPEKVNAQGYIILSTGDNKFTITVTAEDQKTTKTYIVTMKLLEEGQSIPTATTSTTTSTTESTSSTSTTTTTTTTTATTTTLPTETTPSAPSDGGDTTPPDGSGNKDNDDDSGLLSLNVLSLIGIVVGEIALFMLAFFSGYMTHKNASRPPKLTLEDLVAAQEQMGVENYFSQAMRSDLGSSLSSDQGMNAQSGYEQDAYNSMGGMNSMQSSADSSGYGGFMGQNAQNDQSAAPDAGMAPQGQNDPAMMQNMQTMQNIPNQYDEISGEYIGDLLGTEGMMQGGMMDPNAMNGMNGMMMDPNAMNGMGGMMMDPNAMNGMGGMMMDPNAMNGMGGMMMDPNGMNGMMMDPNAMNGMNGMMMDPNGMNGMNGGTGF